MTLAPANMSLASKIDGLKERAACLRNVRQFFLERNILEVDCPALSPTSSIDRHIDVMHVFLGDDKWAYLHTSPEYRMKRLIAAGIGDCYQLGHVYRFEESGRMHNPEFTMIEWYRVGMPFVPFIEETLDLLRVLLGPLSASFITYRAAIKFYTGLDYVYATPQDIVACAADHGHHLAKDADTWDKDTLLQFLLSALVEPHLGKDELLVLHDYPSTQAALARTKQKEDEEVAERFEIYYRGIELANGYHELTNAAEQRRRLYEEEETRRAMGKPPLAVDEKFLHALEEGLPPCCGVAVGFDRLLLLRLGKTSIAEVLPFSWPET